MLVICPGCEEHIADSREILCACGRCMACGRRLKPEDLSMHRMQHRQADFEKLEAKWSIPPGREANARPILALRKCGQIPRFVWIMSISACLLANVIFIQDKDASNWERSLLYGGNFLVGAFIVFIADRLFFRVALPLGKNQKS